MSNHIPFLLKYGTPYHIDSAIDHIAKKRDNDRSWDEKGGLEDLVDSGNKDHIDTMLGHHGINDNIRYHIAKYGDDSHRDTLLKHGFASDPTKEAIAQYGNDSHRDKLLDEKSIRIKKVVAEFGNEKHHEALLNQRFPHSDVAWHINYKTKNPDHKERSRKILEDFDERTKLDADRYGR